MSGYLFSITVCVIFLADGDSSEPSAHDLPHCGPACVYGVLKRLGKEVSIATVERRMLELEPEADLSRLSFAQLRRLIESFGLDARSVQADLRYPQNIPTPAILFLDRDGMGNKASIGHVVLVGRSSRYGMLLTDLTVFGKAQFVSRETLVEISDGRMLLISDQPIIRKVNWVAVSGMAVLLVVFLGVVYSALRRRRSIAQRIMRGLLPWVCTCAIFGGCHDGTRDGGSILSFQARTVDKGVFHHGVDGNAIVCDFPFAVSAQTEVTIEAVEPSCGCLSLTTDVTGVPLTPGSHHILRLQLDTKDRAGIYQGYARIKTRPSSKAPLVVSFRVFVVQLPRPSPAQLVARSSTRGQMRDTVLHITRLRDVSTSPLRLDDKRSTWGQFDLLATAAKPELVDNVNGEVRDHLIITLRPTGRFEIGVHESQIKLAWEGDIPPTVIPALFRVDHPVALQIPALFFGTVKAGEKRRSRIWFRSTDSELVDRLSVDCSLDCVEVAVDKTQSELVIDLTAPNAVGRFDGVVVLSFSEDRMPPLNVKISGVVVP